MTSHARRKQSCLRRKRAESGRQDRTVAYEKACSTAMLEPTTSGRGAKSGQGSRGEGLSGSNESRNQAQDEIPLHYVVARQWIGPL
jgi:hypothetical protein